MVFGVGENAFGGGLAEKARLKSDWLIRFQKVYEAKQSMAMVQRANPPCFRF